MSSTEVLVVGAGPTGLVLALWLTKLGIRARIIDKTAAPGTTSRAVLVQPRVLELYRQIGIADDIVRRGVKLVAGNFWVRGKRVARAPFGETGVGLSPFPYMVVLTQDEHERALIEHLGASGVSVERRTELVGLENEDGHVVASLKLSDGSTEACSASYLAGCDGGRSTVRRALGVTFEGGTYAHLFYVADVEASGPVTNGEVHIALHEGDFLAVFPLPDRGHVRLIGAVRDEPEREGETLGWEDVGKGVLERMGIDVRRVGWFSTYHVHHRIAERLRVGRAFLLGDAAHLHSPAGGQGMNAGIGDAANLAWKLAAVLRGQADLRILATYETERMAFARRLVATTDRVFQFMTSRGRLANLVRDAVLPVAMSKLLEVGAARRLFFRTVSQTAVSYRGSALSEGRAGKVWGGDRLAWVKPADGAHDVDNFVPLSALEWQVHVYGDVGDSMRAACARHHLPLHVLTWHGAMGRAGLQRNAAYLVRPDGHVGLADPEASPTTLEAYLTSQGLRAAPVATRPEAERASREHRAI